MEELPPCKLFEFNTNQLGDVRREFGYENAEQLNKAIDLLDDWIKKQNHFLVKDFDRYYLEHWIISNKGSVEKTKKRFDRLCTMRNLMPEFLRNFDVRKEFEPLLKCVSHCGLPKPTKDNYRIIVSTIHNPEAHEGVTILMYYRYIFVFCEYLFLHDYNAGYQVISDMRNCTFAFLTKLNPIIIQKALTLFLEAYGLRLKSVHLLVNKSKLFDSMVAILKQALSEKLSHRLHIHNSNEELYEYFPREILPKDFGGGEERTIKEMTDPLYEEMCSDDLVARMAVLENARTDEKLRLSSAFNEEYSGMPGSFKSLSVD